MASMQERYYLLCKKAEQRAKSKAEGKPKPGKKEREPNWWVGLLPLIPLLAGIPQLGLELACSGAKIGQFLFLLLTITHDFDVRRPSCD